MDRQARTGDTLLVKKGEMTGRSQTLLWWCCGGRRGKEVGKPRPNVVFAIYSIIFGMIYLPPVRRES